MCVCPWEQWGKCGDRRGWVVRVGGGVWEGMDVDGADEFWWLSVGG